MGDYIISFVVGGAICVGVQILMDNTKLLPGRIMVGLVVLGAVISVFGWYEPFAEWAKAGASVPLLQSRDCQRLSGGGSSAGIQLALLQ